MGNLAKHANSYPSMHLNTTYTSTQRSLEDCGIRDPGRDGGSDVEMLLDESSKSLERTFPAVPREPGYLIDTVGSGATIDTGMMPPVLRSFSPSGPSGSSSCDEVVIFTGRSRIKGRRASQVKSVVGSATDPDTHGDVSVNSQPIEDRTTKLSPLTSATVRVTALSIHSLEDNVISSQPAAVHNRLEQTHNNGNRKKRAKRRTSMIRQKKATEDASFADYIANTSDAAQENSSSAATSSPGQGISATGTDKGRIKTYSSVSKGRAKNISTLSSGWNMSDFEDLQDLSTSSDDFGDVQNVISKRERPSGLQYLVVFEGATVDDARWIRHTSLESQSALKQIRLYDAKKQLQIRCSAGDSDTSTLSGSERGEEPDTDDEREALRDEEDLLRRRIDRLTDEKIARMLAKQEEMGMGSNEVMLFDDHFADDVNNSDNIGTEHVLSTRSYSSSVRHQKIGGKPSKGAFHQAAALANLLDQDSYGGFDVMDQDRPSVKTRTTRRQRSEPFDVSDTELQLSLSSAWYKDRLKKQAKKQEREKLRAQGLLGKKNKKKADLQAKYLDGMTIDQIKDEIRAFIFSTNERYSYLTILFVPACLS